MKYLIAVIALTVAAFAQTGAPAQPLNIHGGQIQVQIVEIHYVNAGDKAAAETDTVVPITIVPLLYAIVNGHHAALVCLHASCPAPEKGTYTGTIDGNGIKFTLTDWRGKPADAYNAYSEYVSLGGW